MLVAAVNKGSRRVRGASPCAPSAPAAGDLRRLPPVGYFISSLTMKSAPYSFASASVIAAVCTDTVRLAVSS